MSGSRWMVVYGLGALAVVLIPLGMFLGRSSITAGIACYAVATAALILGRLWMRRPRRHKTP